MAHPVKLQFLKDQFSERLNTACDNNPNVPPKFHGQQVFIKEKLAEKGVKVTVESIRKWQNGEAVPSNDKIEKLAEVLSIDTSWLMMGDEAATEAKNQRSYNIDTNAAANIVAGLIGMDRGNVSLPLPGKQRAVHFNAVIKGINYPVHVIVGKISDKNASFKVPSDRDGIVVLGLVKVADFQFRVFEILDSHVEQFGEYSKGGVEINAPVDALKEIKDFKSRL